MNFYIKNINKDFILLECWQTQAFNLIVLNKKGELLHTISEKVLEKLDLGCLYINPTFAQLSGNILMYKKPERYTITFWHIPTCKCIQDVEWRELIYDAPLYFGKGVIQDIRFSEGKLTILLSSDHTSASNKPGRFRLIQFDSQDDHPGILSRICLHAKSLYYAI